MDMSRKDFEKKLHEETDTEYLMALEEIAESFSQAWVFEAIRSELFNRKLNSLNPNYEG